MHTRWSTCHSQTSKTTHGRKDYPRIHTVQERRKGLAWSKKPKNRIHHKKTNSETRRPLRNRENHYPASISTETSYPMEDSSHISCDTLVSVLRNQRPWTQLLTSTAQPNWWTRRTRGRSITFPQETGQKLCFPSQMERIPIFRKFLGTRTKPNQYGRAPCRV